MTREENPMVKTTKQAEKSGAEFRKRVWVTRPRPGVDRMSSAWLIRNFIDQRAKFRFAETPQAAARGGVTFDMFGGEFTHEGERCTFETLARRFAVKDPGVAWLAKIVHQVDLKDDREPLPEAVAVARMVEGLRRTFSEDATLLEHGMVFFEALYRSHAAPGQRRAKLE
jgi:hypothetical protein